MSRLISFPQAFALQRGANYNFLSAFKGLDTQVLLSPSGYLFTQPAFETPAPNIWQSASETYSLASSTDEASLGLVFKHGGNLTSTAIKYTNGKSLGNWYFSKRHANQDTGGTFRIEGGVIKLTCGNNTSTPLVNRAMLHDVKFQRNNTEITEQSGSVVGYMQPNDSSLNSTIYFKGYVEPFDFASVFAPTTFPLGDHAIFWIGHRYLHTASLYGEDCSANIPVFYGPSKGWGFVAARDKGKYTWWCVVIADVDNTLDDTGFVFAEATNLSVFDSHELSVTFNNGTITWFANGTFLHTTSISLLESANHNFSSTTNPLYSAIAVMKGSDGVVPSNLFTLCVERAVVTRNLGHINVPYNRFEDTDFEVTETDTDYHITGLHLLKKLK